MQSDIAALHAGPPLDVAADDDDNDESAPAETAEERLVRLDREPYHVLCIAEETRSEQRRSDPPPPSFRRELDEAFADADFRCVCF